MVNLESSCLRTNMRKKIIFKHVNIIKKLFICMLNIYKNIFFMDTNFFTKCMKKLDIKYIY